MTRLAWVDARLRHLVFGREGVSFQGAWSDRLSCDASFVEVLEWKSKVARLDMRVGPPWAERGSMAFLGC
jgi:hypothetical protein